MSRTVTFTELQSRVRSIADQELNSNFVDDTELEETINESVGLWHSMVSAADPERFGATQSITGDGSASYSLPADYLASLGVDIQRNSTRWEPLDHYSVTERHFFEETTTGDAFGYRIFGDQLYLLPAPSSGAYRHLYVTHADVLSAGGDTVDGVNGWETWIIYDAAIKLYIKEQADASQLMAERNKVEVEIRKAAQDRDFSNAGRVVDTRTRHEHGPKGHRYKDSSSFR